MSRQFKSLYFIRRQIDLISFVIVQDNDLVTNDIIKGWNVIKLQPVKINSGVHKTVRPKERMTILYNERVLDVLAAIIERGLLT